MVYAILCALLFALSMTFATRSTQAVGVERATVVRILIAALLLGLWTFTGGEPLAGPTCLWLLLSGAVGMGLGDIAFFRAIPLAGGRLTSLLSQCLSAPSAMAVEWLWLGTRLRPVQMACLAVVLFGVGLSLTQDRGPAEGRERTVSPRLFAWGVVCGVLGSMGTGIGAVLSRRALDYLPAGEGWDGGSAAFYRMVAGAIVTLGFYLPWLSRWSRASRAPLGIHTARRYVPTILNALCGSVLGMAAMQKALSEVPAGVVLAIASTAPIGTMLLLWYLERTRPTARAVVGGLLAVAGVAALELLPTGP